MKLSEERTNFLGIPVTGEINEGSSFVDQMTKEELAPILQAVLDDPLIAEFGWTQYTPYFNDGEPCEFRAHEVWFRTTKDATLQPDEELKAKVSILADEVKANPTTANIAALKKLLDEIKDTIEEEEEDDEEEYYNLTIGNHPILGESYWKNGGYVYPDRTPEIVATAKKCEALSRAIESGHFNMVLTEAFGDHCSIKVTREGITIHGYEHE